MAKHYRFEVGEMKGVRKRFGLSGFTCDVSVEERTTFLGFSIGEPRVRSGEVASQYGHVWFWRDSGERVMHELGERLGNLARLREDVFDGQA